MPTVAAGAHPADHAGAAGRGAGHRAANILRQSPRHRVAPAVRRHRRRDRLHRRVAAPVPPTADREWVLQTAREQFTLEITLEPGAVLDRRKRVNILGPMDDDLAAALTPEFNVPFTMDWTSDPHSVLIHLQLPDGVLDVEAPRKRLAIGTMFLFVGWLVGSALLLFTIAALFMRNQVRAIHRLARSAEAFGMGRDVPAIRPEGAVGGASGRRRVQPHAGTHPPLPGATDRDAGRRVARSAHAADPAAAGAGDAAAHRGTPPGRGRNDRRRGGNGAHDRRLSRLRPRRGHGAGRTGQSGGDPGRRRGRRAARRGGAGAGRAGGPDAEAARRRGAPSRHQPGGQRPPAREGMSYWARWRRGVRCW